MKILTIDTALAACAVAVVDGERVLAQRIAPMERGHQEALAPLVAEAMGEAGVGFNQLERVAVTIGPGSFTGLRVGLAFAKGLALALDIPCVGIGTLEALGAPGEGGKAAVIDARRDQVYLQCFAGSEPLTEPESLAVAEASGRLSAVWSDGPVRLVGPGAALLDGVVPEARVEPAAWCDPIALAHLAAGKPAPAHSPLPLYLRAPDARTIAERAAAAS